MSNHDLIIGRLIQDAQDKMGYYTIKIAELEGKLVEAETIKDALEASLPEEA